MNPSRLVEILDRCRRKRILVVGDVMLDRYVSGSVERICPEAPVPVVRIENEELMLGGCGNVTRNLAPFGLKIQICAVVGSDDGGRAVRRLLAANRVQTAGLFADPSRQTTTKTRVTAERQQMIRLDREEGSPISAETEKRVAAWLRRAIPKADIVLMSDYAKGVLNEAIRKRVFETAARAGVPVLVDPKLSDLRAYQGATLIKPNLREAADASGRPLQTDQDFENACRRLRKAAGCEALVVTRGPQPTAVFLAGRKVAYVPTLAREVYDVSGAGDTMLALLGVALVGGADTIEAVEIANIASGIVVGKVGTARAEESEILAQAAAGSDPAAHKSIDAKRLASMLEDQRGQGRRIVFTNGCFDLLHAGHIRFLQGARRLGDLLIVGLNSDESVRRVKGAPRPFLKQSERVRILTALDCVDYVVVFSEPTPKRLLRQLKPDILVKGREETVESIVGKEIVEAYGGTVRIFGKFEGPTITELSNKIHASLGQHSKQ